MQQQDHSVDRAQGLTPPTAPRWVRWTTRSAVVLAIGVAIYLTIAHFSSPSVLACPDTGVIDCAKVTTSSYSTFLGVPVAILGLAYFLFQGLLALPFAWRSTTLGYIRLATAGLGVCFVLYLIYAEIQIGSICLYCTSIHILTIVYFLVLLYSQVTYQSAASPA